MVVALGAGRSLSGSLEEQPIKVITAIAVAVSARRVARARPYSAIKRSSSFFGTTRAAPVENNSPLHFPSDSRVHLRYENLEGGDETTGVFAMYNLLYELLHQLWPLRER